MADVGFAASIERRLAMPADIAPLKEIQKFFWSQGDYEQSGDLAGLESR